MENLLKFQKDIYDTNVSKGFWSEDRSQGEAVALICSELYEAVEAHRKNKQFDPVIQLVNWSGKDEDFLSWFQGNVKDTVSDEIADTVIRILDCCYGWKWDLTFGKEFGKPSTGNFAYDILRINNYIIKAFDNEQHFAEFKGNAVPYVGHSWYYVMWSIIRLCEWYQINLEQHIKWKLRYNKTRPHLHGKSY